MRATITAVILTAFTALTVSGQTARPAAKSARAIEKTPAYVMLAERKAAAEGEMKDLRARFTETFPEVVAKQYELNFLNAALKEMSAAAGSNARRFDAEYGRLILRKVALQTEVRRMQDNFTGDFPDLLNKRAELAAHESLIRSHLAKPITTDK